MRTWLVGFANMLFDVRENILVFLYYSNKPYFSDWRHNMVGNIKLKPSSLTNLDQSPWMDECVFFFFIAVTELSNVLKSLGLT